MHPIAFLLLKCCAPSLQHYKHSRQSSPVTPLEELIITWLHFTLRTNDPN